MHFDPWPREAATVKLQTDYGNTVEVAENLKSLEAENSLKIKTVRDKCGGQGLAAIPFNTFLKNVPIKYFFKKTSNEY